MQSRATHSQHSSLSMGVSDEARAGLLDDSTSSKARPSARSHMLRPAMLVGGLFIVLTVIMSLRSGSLPSIDRLRESSETGSLHSWMDLAPPSFKSSHAPPVAAVASKPAPLDGVKPARIIKVTAAYGKGAITLEAQTKEIIGLRERVLQSHYDHAERNGHVQHVQTSDMLSGIFTKCGSVLNVLLMEMAKPADQRSEWIWAHDSDMVIMNRMLSLEVFLPPADKDYNLLVTMDGNGLNIGSFFIKINTWSVELLSAILGSQHLSFGSQGLYPDQDVMGELIKNVDYFKEKAIEIPRRWVNAYPHTWGAAAYNDGDLLVHCVWFAKKDLPYYLDKSETLASAINLAPNEFALGKNITMFWDGTLEREAV